MVYDDIADLPVHITGYEFEQRERDTSGGFTRTTTVVTLTGEDVTGRGEDVTYETEAHEALEATTVDFPVTGEYTIDEFTDHVADIDFFFGQDPEQEVYQNYRRWAFESAALDLALKQANTNLAEQLDLEYKPVRFVMSSGLDDPPTGDRIMQWLDLYPDLELKLDPTPAWTDVVVERLADTNAVRILDLKGQYEGTTVDQPADPVLYDRILTGFPEAFIEDPAVTDDTRPLLKGNESRVTWDYPIDSINSIKNLPWDPDWLNCKPSRFGSVRSLFKTIEYCHDNEIQLYGGGQFELDVGREHIHALASLFYPDSPNDVAPKAYNDPEPTSGLPPSPLIPPTDPIGLEWN